MSTDLVKAPQVPAATAGLSDPLEIWRQQFNRFPAEKYNVLAPQEIGAVAPMHRPVLAVVQLDTRLDDKHNPVGGDIYPIPGSWGKFGLSKVALDRVAQAASIIWDWRASGRTDDGRNPKKVAYRAVGRIKNMDGQWRILIGDKELDLDVIEQELLDSVPARWDRMDEKKRPRGVTKEAWVHATVAKDLLQFRKHMLARAQSGAMNRAIRAALAIRSSYGLEDLRKPFVVPKMVFTPDYSDPDVKRFMLAQATGVVEELYGQRPEAPALGDARAALPAPEPEVLQDPDTGDLIDRRTGEVLRDNTPPDDEGGAGESAERPRPNGQAAAAGEPGVTPQAPSAPLPDADLVAWAEAHAAEDATREVAVLERLMRRKGYQGELKKPVAKFDAHERKAFFAYLAARPDAAAAAPELPF